MVRVKCEIELFGKRVSMIVDVPNEDINCYLYRDKSEKIEHNNELMDTISEMLNEAIRDSELEKLEFVDFEILNQELYPIPPKNPEKEYKTKYNLKRV